MRRLGDVLGGTIIAIPIFGILLDFSREDVRKDGGEESPAAEIVDGVARGENLTHRNSSVPELRTARLRAGYGIKP